MDADEILGNGAMPMEVPLLFDDELEAASPAQANDAVVFINAHHSTSSTAVAPIEAVEANNIEMVVINPNYVNWR